MNGSEYRVATLPFPGFGAAPVYVSVLSALSATNSSVGSSRAFELAFIAAFLLLALAFAAARIAGASAPDRPIPRGRAATRRRR